MAITISVGKYITVFNVILRAAALIFFIAMLGFCGFYLFAGYDTLAKWFVSLNGCFYLRDTWTSNFFTPQVKSTGNWYCAVAMLITLGGIFYCLRPSKRNNKGPLAIKLLPSDLLVVGICTVVVSGLWIWANSLTYASNDEVFSAINCAELHPFQTWAYYMLPNNHILFNLLNNLIFHGVEDKVVSGRIISLCCYLTLVIMLLFWWRSIFHNKWLALIMAFAMALQFPVFGFAAQARGYELLTLAGWVSFISFFSYLLSGHSRWLPVLALAGIVGYLTIPTFLYFHAAIIAFAIFYQLFLRRADFVFWRWQLITFVITFLLYLPALCFSGYHSLAGNTYVTMQHTYHELLGLLPESFKEYMDFCFCNPIRDFYAADLLLFLMPLCLFFFRRNQLARLLGAFYVVMWGVCAGFILKMKFYPIDRALTVQYSITYALALYTAYLSVTFIFARLNSRALPVTVLSVFILLLSANYIRRDRTQIGHHLCHFPVNGWYDFITDGLKQMPQGSSVGYSDESFYWYYICRQKGYPVHKCNAGNEDYYIKTVYEQLPADRKDTYTDYKRIGDFNVYKRK